ncbi:MAG: hypothetical protein O2782_12085 [bacterium]|nr:hypothetical protein [bacterium]
MRILVLLVILIATLSAGLGGVRTARAASSPALPGEQSERQASTQSAPVHAWQPHVTLRLQTSAARADALSLQQHISGHLGPWRLAVLSERDPGEQRWHDHVVGYVQRSSRRLDLAVGTLRPAFGQGLLFGRGMAAGVPAPTVRKDDATLGYRSAAEARTMDGAAVRWRGAAWSGALLAGVVRWDARVADEGTVRALPEGGDHSGSGEAVRDRLHGSMVAGRWTLRARRAEAGLSVQRTVFTRQIDLRGTETPYAFRGRQLSSVAADAKGHRGALRWYAAVARAGHRTAGLAGVSGMSAAGMHVDVLGRCYAAGFFSPLGAAASGAEMNNERGLTVQARAGRRWRAWADLTQRPAPRWRQPLPTHRRAAGVRGTTRIGRWQCRADLQQRANSAWIGAAAGDETTTRARLQGVRSQGRLRLTLSADGVDYRRDLRGAREPGRRGVSASAAVRWQPARLQVNGLLSLFHTAGYATRVYEYEPQLPGAVSIRPLYGRGLRLAAVCSTRVGPLQVGVRWRLQAAATGMQHVAAVQIETLHRSR